MPIVFAAAVTTSSPRVSPFSPRRMLWTGHDGSVWNFTRPLANVPALGPGVKGLHEPPMTVYKSSTPLVAGVDLLGYSLPERPVYWPLIFAAKSIDAWRAAYSGFFDSIDPVRAGIWTVGEGDEARTLPLVGIFDGDYAFNKDPFTTGRALIGLELEAPRPMWRGKPIRRTFGAVEGVDFIPPEMAPTFHLSPAATFQTAKIDNPGDEPAYLVWTVDGPSSDVLLGVGESVIEVPFAIDEGSQLVIDTDPANQYATLDGVDVTRELGFQQFAPVPARGTTPLVIGTSGSGSVSVEIVPLHRRAF